MSEEIQFDGISRRMREIQDRICNMLVDKSGQEFHEDAWEYHNGGGGGRTRVWESEDGALEKGGVNYSAIQGQDLPSSAAVQLQIPPNSKYQVTGVSLVIHPRSPHVPTIHMNIRYFECPESQLWWCGGGIDLTPYYPVHRECVQFHQRLRDVCERHGQPYGQYKSECDEYFTLKHRNEMRGIGGIFFDKLSAPGDEGKAAVLNFVFDVGRAFNDLYGVFLDEGRLLSPVAPEQREFQLIRRGRYVEFNLVYDRGTKFGLQSNGRTESILMSLPTTAQWRYNWKPKEGSEEAAITAKYFQPQPWVDLME